MFFQEIMLRHPLPSQPFILRADSSGSGIGGALSQLNTSHEEQVISRKSLAARS